MERTKIVDFQEFMTQILPRPTVAVPKTPKKLLFQIQTKFRDFFKQKKRDHTVRFKEDDLAETMVGIINEHHLCGGYVAALARSGSNSTNPKGANVDAMIYPQDRTPADDRPDWTHSRIFMNFQRGGSFHDPFDNTDDNSSSRTDARPRTDAHPQLFAQAYNTMLYQHRTAVYALFINGPEFRGMRYDRAGLIVSKATNYVKTPAALLEVLATFGRLGDEAQGLDPTATLIEEYSSAFKLMDEYAEDPGTDMDYLEGTMIPPYIPPPQPTPPRCSMTASSFTPSDATLCASLPGRRSPRLQAKQAEVSRQAGADALCEYDSDLVIEIPSDDSDPHVFKYVRARFRESLQGGWPRYKLRVGEEKRVFLVGMPTFCGSSLFGRGTRCYVALDARSRRFVFLKDSWRPCYDNVESEGYYLDVLGRGPHAHDFVPRLLCHGNVEGQTTVYHSSRFNPDPRYNVHMTEGSTSSQPRSTSPLVNRPSTAGSKRSRDEYEDSDRNEIVSEDGRGPEDTDAPASRDYRHYRIVSKDICLPFDSFTSAEQLVRFLSHCVLGHGYAYEDHQLLHRDISAGNVLILPRLVDAPELGPGMKIVTWNGILCDWELAKFVPKNGSLEEAQQAERTGTWQFMSVHYVDHHARRPVTIADELESFFHGLLFYAVRRLHHNIESPSGFVAEYFDGHDPVVGRRACSVRKKAAMRSGMLESSHGPLKFFTDGESTHQRFHALINGLLGLLNARYQVLQYDAMQATRRATLVRSSRTSLGTRTPNAHVVKRAVQIPNPWQEQMPTDTSAGRHRKTGPTLSEGTRARADDLKKHAAFYNVFDWVLDPSNPEFPPWPHNGDVNQDKVPSSFDPRRMVRALEKRVAAAFRMAMDEVRAGTRADEPSSLKRFKTAISEPDIDRAGPSIVRPATAPHVLMANANPSASRDRRTKRRRRACRGAGRAALPVSRLSSSKS